MSRPSALEHNKHLVRRLFDEVFNQGDVSALGSIVATDYRQHNERVAGGSAGLAAYVLAVRAAFPDFHIEVLDVIAEHDRVCVRTCARGTHRGPFNGVPATGRRVELGGMDIFRIEGELLAEHWDAMDNLALLEQLGVHVAPP
ncbi:Hypothetical protein A7982_02104 [Minicystis rosea]|nr:Hypothetical protein A7982_02104 [Minicystis rosea]